MKGTQPARSSKRKARGTAPQVIVDNQTMIPGNIYQAWLKDASSLVSKRRRVRNKINPIQTTKTSDLMSLPPVALMSYLENSEDWYYPKQLMQLWKECTEAKSPKPSSLDSIEMTRGKKSAEFGKVHDSPHGHCSVTPGNLVTPGSPGLSRRSASRSGGSGRVDSCH
uniref:Uncharacterized protein n=1 Tax=Avena sativa TaxID=4498 RepID=A0ACD5UVV9_AVESA